MTGRPLRWRARWLLAQITGVLFSTAVWIVASALVSSVVLAVMLVGLVFVAVFRTRPVLWLRFGARRAAGVDRDVVLRAIVPIVSLRGRGQPAVFVGPRRRLPGRDVAALGGRVLVVSDSLLARIKAGQVSDGEVSVQVAHALGQARALGSRLVVGIRMYCLPWEVVDTVVSAVAGRLARVPLMSLSWRMRPLVFGLGLVDAVQHARWEAAVPLLVMSVLTYTTRPLERAWQRRLLELGDRRVADEGLGSAVDGESTSSDLGRVGDVQRGGAR